LQSIKNQVFIDWECLIIDDGGTDNTKEVVAPFLEQDTRFQFFKREDKYKKGLPGCRNYGLDIAKGDCVIFFDDDDFIHPENLKISLAELNDTTIDFCTYQKCAYVGARPDVQPAVLGVKQKLTPADIAKVVTQEIGLASCTVLWRRTCFETIRFNETLLYAEEWECYLRLLSENFKGIQIDTVLYYNRKHAASNTGEFYRNSPIRKVSKKEAIVLVLQNIKEKQLLTPTIIRYFVTIAVDYKEYNLFRQLLDLLELSDWQRTKWFFFYYGLPIRMVFYKLKKSMHTKN
jgi:glycosyltransferase involved in cell wall biosynthesis